MESAFDTALTGIQSDVLGFASIALPVALGIVGLFMAVKYGIKFFKSVSK